MPIFTPSRRWQKPFYPFKKRRFSERVEEALERSFKGVLWGCRMCGNCLLQETAFICPMACSKGLRNGPCGGSTPDHCCVDDSRPCIWYAIFTRAKKMGRLDRLLEVMPPLDWDKTGTSALQDVFTKISDHGVARTTSIVIKSSHEMRKSSWEKFFYEIRQPDWWAGDSHPHPAPSHEPVSKLEKILSAGEFALTCEVVPPASADISSLDEELSALKDLVDAVNFTDNASATANFSPIACGVRALELGLEPVIQMTARDRTRLSFQSDLLAAAGLGMRNLLFITGDHPNRGEPPFSRMDIWDFDSIQAIWMARRLRDEGIFVDGRHLIQKPSYFIGTAAAPFASTPKYQAIRAEKKVNAGAQFFQTNLIFDTPKFEAYLEALDQRNVLSRVHLIAGIAPIRSIKTANRLRQLPGVFIPEKIMSRLEAARDVKAEAHQISLELMDQIKSLPGVQGIHLMAIGDITDLKRLILESGLRKSL